MKILVNPAYWPNIEYMMWLINAEEVFIELNDNYQKQSYRNRFRILTANGPLTLSYPVAHQNSKIAIKDVKISYADKWRQQHWGAIRSAYGNSPFFDFFSDEISAFYEIEYKTLVEFNLAQLTCLLKILRIEKKINYTSEYQEHFAEILDLRDKIHPKNNSWIEGVWSEKINLKYYQTFSEKFDFVPNMSVLDLLFNVGLGAKDYLKKV